MGARDSRKNIIGTLDEFMPDLRKACGCCLVKHLKIVQHPHMSACSASDVPFMYRHFKRLFNYERYQYCQYCGTPQERSFNGEVPSCHRNFVYANRIPCDWEDLPYVVVWTIWHLTEYRNPMIAHFELPVDMTQAQFERWIVQEDAAAGEFTKLLQVYIWFYRTFSSQWSR